MPPATDFSRLAQLQGLLAEALAREDWVRIGQVDGLIRQCLEGLQNAQPFNDETRLKLAPLKALHGHALQACARECARLSQMLANHTEYAEGRHAYSLADSLQGVN